MKKPPFILPENQEPAAALMALISEELKKAEKQENAASLVDWLDMGRIVLDKFGDSNETKEFRFELEKTFKRMGVFGESRDSTDDSFEAQSAAFQPLPYEDKFTPEAAASVMNSCILFCDVVIAGEDAAAGLKYDDENMFMPMIVFLEKNDSAAALAWAAETLEVPVVKNNLLAKNLVNYGKIGEGIPDSSCREVYMVFTRLTPVRHRSHNRELKKNRQGVPVKVSGSLSVELGVSLYELTGEGPGREKLLAAPLNAIRTKLKTLLGLSVPPFRVSCAPALKSNEYRIFFKGLEAGRGTLDLAWYDAAKIAQGRISPAENICLSMVPDLMLEEGSIQAAAGAASSFIVSHAEKIIQRRAQELLGREEVNAILDTAEEKLPVVTGEVKSLLSLGIIRDILQSLVSEQVSIRHMDVILETLADWGGFGPAPSITIIEQIRQALKRQICLDYADDTLVLRVLTLEEKLEKKLEEAPAEGAANKTPPEHWLAQVSFAAQEMKEKGYPPVFLCSPRARFPMREAIRAKLPEAAVLSYLEIPPDFSVVPMGEIKL